MSDYENFQNAAASADDPEDKAQKAALDEERACTKRWLEKIKCARDYDKAAREQYARDRRYARGDDGQFDVSVPIAAANIDVLNGFLFAKNPDVSVDASPSTQPPPRKELEAKARDEVQQQTKQQMLQAGQALAPALGSLAANGQLGNVISQIAPAATQLMANSNPQQQMDQQAKDTASQQMAPYQQLRSDARQIAQTMELVIAQLWKLADLKKQGLPLVRSALSIGVGWLKCTWQEPPQATQPLQADAGTDQEGELAKLQSSQEELAEGETNDEDYAKADIALRQQGIAGKSEQAIARGLVIDFVPAEDIQVATECGPLINYLNSPWLAHRSFIPVCDAKAQLPKVAEKLKNAQLYYPRRLPSKEEGFGTNGNDVRDVGSIANVSAKDADQYTTDNAGMDADKGSVCVWEIWDKDTGTILTLVDGVKEYAKDPYTPDPATCRWYPFFLYPIGVVDGERHPVSLIHRSYKLLDERNRARSNWRTARFRAIPKVAFDKGELSTEEADNLKSGINQEMVGITLTSPDKKLGDIMAEVPYAQIDEKLFDTGPIDRDLEKSWGVQEALTQGVSVAKTATEAEIQQTGTNSRTGYMKDALDDMFTDLANYTAQVALQKMQHDDVVRIAGSYALWPEGLNINDIGMLMEISIRAGSSGKPNTAAKQAVWATVMPQISQEIMQIGQLRGSTPEEIANCKEELIVETMNRTGERIDADRFIPDAPPQDQPPQPQGPPPKPSDQALMGPQIIAMTQVCDQVRTNMLSPVTAIAVLTAAFPSVSVQQIENMVKGVAALPPAPTPQQQQVMQANAQNQNNGATQPPLTDTVQ